MNRIVLIGNGFDLAHGLPTRYQDFIDWYWEQRIRGLCTEFSPMSKDILLSLHFVGDGQNTWHSFMFLYNFMQGHDWREFYDMFHENKELCKIQMSPFFERICKSIETKKWVDIENEYYELLKEYSLHSSGLRDSLLSVQYLNKQLQYLEQLLIKYLSSISITNAIKIEQISKHIYESISKNDISVNNQSAYDEHINYWLKVDEYSLCGKLEQCGVHRAFHSAFIEISEAKKAGDEKKVKQLMTNYDYDTLSSPNQIMLLSFNYTDTARLYLKQHPTFECQYIHGTLDKPESVIFGYGDELDAKYKEILDKNENEYLHNIKSIRYLESDNYRKMLQFIDSAPFQIYIMGHSCGNSDRTLLNTLFEHKNCISIKPFYYTWTEKDKDGNEQVKDNYLEIIQNISRNFTDMKKFRDRVVNKLYCKEITK